LIVDSPVSEIITVVVFSFEGKILFEDFCNKETNRYELDV